MEKLTKEQKIKLIEMKQYLGEWFFFGTTSKIVPGKYDSGERTYQILDATSDEVIFEHLLGIDVIDDENALVSTNGIKNEELRGLIEQSIELDKQIAYYNSLSSPASLTTKQKGE